MTCGRRAPPSTTGKTPQKKEQKKKKKKKKNLALRYLNGIRPLTSPAGTSMLIATTSGDVQYHTPIIVISVFLSQEPTSCREFGAQI